MPARFSRDARGEAALDAIVVRKFDGGSNRRRQLVNRLRSRGDVRPSTEEIELADAGSSYLASWPDQGLPRVEEFVERVLPDLEAH